MGYYNTYRQLRKINFKILINGSSLAHDGSEAAPTQKTETTLCVALSEL